MNNPIHFLSTFWMTFSFSFLVALTGAMSPGPLLTYTIIKSIKSDKRGYLIGLWVILGHALLEMGIIFVLLLGFSFALKNTYVVKTIGVIGGLILVYFGFTIVRSIYLKNIGTSFLENSKTEDTNEQSFQSRSLENPIIGGILVSMSNPYWWIWWATIGFAFMVQFKISFKQWPELLAFFLGHEAGDLIWYLLISFLAFFGLRHLNRKIYYSVLFLCGAFMIFFGLYLGLSPFFRQEF